MDTDHFVVSLGDLSFNFIYNAATISESADNDAVAGYHDKKN